MHKKNLIFYFLAGSLIVLILFLKSDKKSTLHNDSNFAVSDISSISKIFIADRNGNTITLTKESDNWKVNDKFSARKDAIKILLKTINRIRVKRPVSISAFPNVIKFMSTSGVKVEIYNIEKLIKSYTIGSNTPDHLGTYMLMLDSKTPYEMHIPAFNGFLSTRYGIQANSINVKDWRSLNIFNLKREDINNLIFTDIQNKHNSYSLYLNWDLDTINPINLLDYNNIAVQYNREKIFSLLNSFENINCETFKKEKYKLDSSKQLHELIINSDTLRTFQMSNSKIRNKEENYTVNRMYATINNGELMLIQNYVFNKLLININELKN